MQKNNEFTCKWCKTCENYMCEEISQSDGPSRECNEVMDRSVHLNI